ncbi:hypothetical protein PInf_021126 [Phytophthora infestans]|nr:hypothetical protein PInf_021126 [Phytophthora infestans]
MSSENWKTQPGEGRDKCVPVGIWEDQEIGTVVRWNENGVRENVSGYGVYDSVSETEEWGCANAIGELVALGYESRNGLAAGFEIANADRAGGSVASGGSAPASSTRLTR